MNRITGITNGMVQVIGLDDGLEEESGCDGSSVEGLGQGTS